MNLFQSLFKSEEISELAYRLNYEIFEAWLSTTITQLDALSKKIYSETVLSETASRNIKQLFYAFQAFYIAFRVQKLETVTIQRAFRSNMDNLLYRLELDENSFYDLNSIDTQDHYDAVKACLNEFASSNVPKYCSNKKASVFECIQSIGQISDNKKRYMESKWATEAYSSRSIHDDDSINAVKSKLNLNKDAIYVTENDLKILACDPVFYGPTVVSQSDWKPPEGETSYLVDKLALYKEVNRLKQANTPNPTPKFFIDQD